jgi:hypothetical protein
LLTGWAKLFHNMGIREFAMLPDTRSSVELMEQMWIEQLLERKAKAIG